MEPKQKAKELVEKFRCVKNTQPSMNGINSELAKQCALICVDEIIKYQPFDVYSLEQCNNVNTYWAVVREEITKL